MISTLDKAILGVTGVAITAITGGAAAFSARMIRSSMDLGATAPAIEVAKLSRSDGEVKTRHREVLAWMDAGGGPRILREGDRVRTLADAHAEIHYDDDGLVVIINPNSQITVHAPVTEGGERRVAAIDVVDGSIRATVASGHALDLRDAAGHDQGHVEPTGDHAEIAVTAPASADGSVTVKPIDASVSVKTDGNSQATTLDVGIERTIGVDLVAPTPTPTAVAIAIPTATPPLPMATGLAPLGTVDSTTPDTTIRQPLPAGVVRVKVHGREAQILDNGTFSVAIYGLNPGMNEVDVEYKFADGHWARQIQRIRVH